MVLAVQALGPTLAAGQESGWNSPRAVELMKRARERRMTPRLEPGLKDYRAHADGYIYFYLDRRNSDERTLVRTDQIALEMYWAAPNMTKQRIVGLRNENALPNRMYYHLDHLSVVQNGFGNRIRVGEGDEVRDVLHPAAPGADSVYDFRLADSLTLRLPTAPGPVRVYEINVRPRHPDEPGFLGSVFVDRATADIVRMKFTFTPASYIDRRLDYINIALDYGLWEGRYWLPHEQRLEIRRQIPELDFVVGAVIQGRLDVSDYQFNVDLPPSLFYGPPVSVLPREQRESYPFTRGIYADLNEAGLAPPGDLKAIRAEAMTLVRQHILSGLPRLRINLPDASSAFHYNRSEGIFLGGGLSYDPAPQVRLGLTSGFAFGSGHADSELRIITEPGSRLHVEFSLFANQLRDMGVRPGIPGALNTLSSAFLADDYLDPYLASGAAIRLRRQLSSSWSLRASMRSERQRSAGLAQQKAPINGSDPFRPVRKIAPGEMTTGTLVLRRDPARNEQTTWSGNVELRAGAFDGRGFLRPSLDLTLQQASADRSTTAQLRFAAGAVTGAPPQELFLLGGINTLPGYQYRSFSGRTFAVTDAVVSRDLWAPWLRLRILGAAGWSASLPDTRIASEPLATAWGVAATGGIRTSLGAGLGIFYDILHFDLVRGLNGGSWQFLFSVPTEFWSFL